MSRLTREQLRRRKHHLTLIYAVACLITLFVLVTSGFVRSNEQQKIDEEVLANPVISSEVVVEQEVTIEEEVLEEVEPDIEVEVKPPVENVEVEVAPSQPTDDGLNKIENVKITHYCAEKYAHICNAGAPYKTARGNDVIPNYTCAVDPNVIPLGSTVYIDYGDGIKHEYLADDTGGAIKGSRIDVAVDTHDIAMNCGVKRATVYWE